MGIDNETTPNYINIVLDNKTMYIKSLKKQADDDGQNDSGDNKISVTSEKHTFQTDEYYFDERENQLYISGNMVSKSGETYVSISMPLSDTVLIDILAHGIKKLNKLKTALESLN